MGNDARTADAGGGTPERPYRAYAERKHSVLKNAGAGVAGRRAVGGGSAPAQEQRVQLAQRHLPPGRRAVVALVGAGRATTAGRPGGR